MFDGYVNDAKKHGAGDLGLEKSEILDFVRQMKATDHVIMFYSKPEDKHLILFTYLKAGLDQGEAAAYVVAEESPDQIRQAMRRFGIDVNRLEKSGALRVTDYRDWYIVRGKFNQSKILELWKKLYDESIAKGFKGLRITGETACFFKHRLVKELVKYEKALHRVLRFPITAICAYDTDVVVKEGRGELYLDLIKAHSTVIFAGPEGGLVKSLGDSYRTQRE